MVEESYGEQYAAWKGWEPAQFGTCRAPVARQFAAELARLPLPSRALRVLDVGFGNGAFIGWARGEGHRCDGVELNPVLRELATRHGVSAFNDLAAVPAAAYDLLTAFDVCEHIDVQDLVPFFKEARARLAPQGVMLVRVPNGDSPLSGIYQRGDMTHRTLIGSGMLRQIADQAGMDLLFADAPARSGESLQQRARDLGRRCVEYVIGRLYYDGQVVSFDPNLVAAMRPRRAVSA
ncbi:class I SAM-dependent methyltransferase [Uliginosibacterium sp. sgz301328]|uniref:class I SAM-dependent methyltransferase n=1 Tax=Uliginosibacterium sp. sgz301328 TaxID=3243764 RepID=UPI00359D6939